MKTIKTLLSVMLCFLALTTSCTDTTTTVSYGFYCSENLFQFVDITATYETKSGEYTSTQLSPSNMIYTNDEEDTFETSEGNSSTSVARLAWRQNVEYDGGIEVKLTISFSKKDGVDYSAYKGQIVEIYNNAYLHSTTKKEGFHSVSIGTNLDLTGLVTTPRLIYGDALEDYIDELVSDPIVRSNYHN